MSRMRKRLKSKITAVVIALAVGVLSGCSTNFFARSDGYAVVARSGDFVVVSTGRDDTLSGLAEAFLGDPGKYWVIAEFNKIDRIRPGQQLVIPLKATADAGILRNGYKKVAILAYHRFVPGDRKCDLLSVSATSFRSQLEYLRENGFTVVSFSDLADFIEGKGPMPRKPVILSMDDGYKSVYQVAYPVLREFGYKATVFVYTDFIGAPAGLNWAEMGENDRIGAGRYSAAFQDPCQPYHAPDRRRRGGVPRTDSRGSEKSCQGNQEKS